MTMTATVPDERHASLETPAVPNIELQDAISKVGSTRATTTTNGCCRWVHFNDVDMAKGYNILGTARGAIIMSNIFLSTSFIYLASEQAGCVDDQGTVVDKCSTNVYGFSPTSLITNIAVISGLLSAIFMPIIGAMVDYTRHRKSVGVSAAAAMTLIQAIQIGTVEQTWFAMALLQAFSGFLYQVEVLATFSYLPDIARIVGEVAMTKNTATFTMVQFGSQVSFLIVTIVLALALGLDDVQTAQLSQGINTVWVGIGFYFGWKLLPHVAANHILPQGRRLLTQGFYQNIATATLIQRHYNKGLKWFLLATVFGAAAVNAFTVVAVVYLADHINMTGTEIGLFFIVTLFGTLPGSVLGAMVTRNTNPNVSLRLCALCLIVVTIVGALLLQEGDNTLAYVWGVCIGILLGWFYPTENLFFSMCLPKGLEAELAGFFVYCTQILVWLPPLLFSILVQNDINQKYGVMSVTLFFMVAIVLLSCAAPWEEILEQAADTDIVDEKPLDETESLNEIVSNDEAASTVQKE